MCRHRKSGNAHGHFQISPRKRHGWMLRVVDLVGDLWILLLPTVFLGFLVLGYYSEPALWAYGGPSVLG